MWLLTWEKYRNCIFWNCLSKIFVFAYQTTRCQNPEDTAPVRQVRGKVDASLAVPARRALRVARSVSQSDTTRHASRPFGMTAGSAAVTSIPICREWGDPRILVQCMTYNNSFLLAVFK
jgi:hypothetical protein